MADKTHLDMLRKGVRAWNEWREAHADLHPDLATASLIGLDLIGINLAGADLRNADLRGTNLSNAVLTGATLDDANFFKTILDGADLAGASLRGAKSLTSHQLMTARNWRSTVRDLELACGTPLQG